MSRPHVSTAPYHVLSDAGAGCGGLALVITVAGGPFVRGAQCSVTVTLQNLNNEPVAFVVLIRQSVLPFFTIEPRSGVVGTGASLTVDIAMKEAPGCAEVLDVAIDMAAAPPQGLQSLQPHFENSSTLKTRAMIEVCAFKLHTAHNRTPALLFTPHAFDFRGVLL